MPLLDIAFSFLPPDNKFPRFEIRTNRGRLAIETPELFLFAPQMTKERRYFLDADVVVASRDLRKLICIYDSSSKSFFTTTFVKLKAKKEQVRVTDATEPGRKWISIPIELPEFWFSHD